MSEDLVKEIARLVNNDNIPSWGRSMEIENLILRTYHEGKRDGMQEALNTVKGVN